MTVATEEQDLKGIWDEYTEEERRELRPLLSSPDGVTFYHLVVREATAGTWEKGSQAGNPRLDVSTTVACGPHAGQFGPRLTLSFGGFTANSGRVWTTKQAYNTALRPALQAIHPQPIGGIEPPITAEKFAVIGQALMKHDFVAGVVRQGDYDAIAFGKLYPMTKVPDGFSCEHTLAQFKL